MITDIEAALGRLITYALATRQPLASLATLANVPLLSGLRYVAGQGVFEWQAYSTATVDGVSVIASTKQSRGRWQKVVTPWTYGAGGTNLGAVTSGYLNAVEVYDSDDIDAMLERVEGRTPAVLLRFAGDAPASDSILPGTFYKDSLDFVINVISSNLRGQTTATQGSPLAGEAAYDPGVYKIIGDLRRVICGVSPAFGVEGVERAEIGPATRIDEDADRRLFTYAMAVTVKNSFEITDQDLIDGALNAQPALTDHRAATFNADNYVAGGCGLAEGLGAGFDRTIEAGRAFVGGVEVTTDETAHAFAADQDCYRDLDATGAWTFTAVDVYSDQPALAAGSMRVAITRTDDVGIVADVALCSYSVPLGDPIPIA